jgi:TonB family protein
VFIMTGVYKDRVYRTEALRTYGASEYFEKPLKMAELLASVEAVLGKPEPARPESRPAVEPQPQAAVKPAQEIRPEAAPPAEARRRERPASDDSIFSLPEDLDRLSREIPKARKPAPSAPRPEPAAEAKLESSTEDLLKSVLAESTDSRSAQPTPGGGNGNGNGRGGADIDQFLKSALAGLDLKKEKIKVPKTAPLPTPPAPPAPPVKAAPSATPPAPPPVSEPKPVPRPAPRLDNLFSTSPDKDMKTILTPGDPGSDISPFFTPEKPKPEAAVERPKIHPAPVPPPPPVAPPRRPQTADQAEKKAVAEALRHEPVRHEPARPEPARHEPVKPGPVRHEPVRPEPLHPEPKAREAAALASADIFQGIIEPRQKKGFPTAAAVIIGVVVLAAAGFILLRPKRGAQPVENLPPAVQTVLEPEPTASEPVAEVPPPEVKTTPVKPKPKPKSADPDPAGADAILPAGAEASALTLAGISQGPATGDEKTAPGTKPLQSDSPPATKEQTAPPATETKPAGDPAQATAGGAGTEAAGQPPAVEAAVSMPEAVPVKEGELVELSSVTEPPKLIKSVDPVYPPSAQRQGVGGSITVNALIDENGNVIETGILKGIQDDKGLGRAAQNAVRKWKFQPARKNGVAVKVWKSFIIAFRAETTPANETK